MRAVWQLTTDNMFVVLLEENGRFLVEGVNLAQAQVVHKTPEELAGRYLDEITPPDICQEAVANYRRCLSSGTPMSYEEKVSLDKPSYWYTLLVPLPDEFGNFRRIFGTSRETTELHHLADALKETNANLEDRVRMRTSELSEALSRLEKEMAKHKAAEEKIKTLRGLLPICSICKKVRDDKGYWTQLEQYVREHSEAEFTHGLCMECAKKHYSDFMK